MPKTKRQTKKPIYEPVLELPPLSKEDLDALRGSIAANGVLVPILIYQEGNTKKIVDGNYRRQIAIDLGYDCPESIIEATDDQELRMLARSLNVARRQLTTLQKREIIADQLKETPDVSNRRIAKAIGVHHATVGTVRRELEEEGIIEVLDVAIGDDGHRRRLKKEPKRSISQTSSNSKLVCMDALKFLMKTDDQTYDLIIADPPYFKIKGDFDQAWNNVDEYMDWCRSWMVECHRVLKDSGSFFVWGVMGYNNGFALPRLIHELEDEKLFKVVNWITQKNTRGRGTKRGFMSSREELVFMVKSKSYKHYPAYLNELNKRDDAGADGKARQNTHKRCTDVWADITEASQSKYERVEMPDGSSFPTVKAQELCRRIIQSSTDEGNLIFVPFAGSGSECLAAKNLKRHFHACEINRQTQKIAKKRITTG